MKVKVQSSHFCYWCGFTKKLEVAHLKHLSQICNEKRSLNKNIVLIKIMQNISSQFSHPSSFWTASVTAVSGSTWVRMLNEWQNERIKAWLRYKAETLKRSNWEKCLRDAVGSGESEEESWHAAVWQDAFCSGALCHHQDSLPEGVSPDSPQLTHPIHGHININPQYEPHIP